MAITELRTKDISGNNLIFYFDNEGHLEENILKFRIYTLPEQVSDPSVQSFQFDIRVLKNKTFKVETISALGNSTYLKKGIPEAFVLYFHSVYKNLVSSSNNENFKTSDRESRNPSASKVWRRLLLLGKAAYDPEKQQYFVLDKGLDNLSQIEFSSCLICGAQIPSTDIEWKIDHCIENHIQDKLSTETTPLALAERLFNS